MKFATSKVYALLGVGLCLAAMIFFINQNVVTANYTADETVSDKSEVRAETRCGWFVNPTPGNAWLNDKDGEWMIGAQGGTQADGDWPGFKDSQWIKTNGSYGYGCACMTVTTDKKEMQVLTIKNAKARPISACRKDKNLKKPD